MILQRLSSGPLASNTSRLQKPAVSRPKACYRARMNVFARFGAVGRSGSGTPQIGDRILAALPYLLPFFNAFTYGRYLFYMYPVLKGAIKPVLPVLAAYHSIPFGSMIAFFGLYMGVVNNRSMTRFVRFNAMQAMLLDILLVLPRLIESVFTPPASGAGLQMYAHSQSFVWIFITTWVVFGVVSSLMGQYARIPFIGDAAEQQIR